MRKTVAIIFFICLFSVTAIAQGLIKPELSLPDTSKQQVIKPGTIPLNNIITGEPSSPENNLDQYSFPKLNLNEKLFNLKQDYGYYIYNPKGLTNVDYPFIASPFLNSATIFNQSAYRLSDKFLIGGNSFGARSIFTAPLPNSLFNTYDLRGASLFFQYRVSKNLKIETHVGVTNRQF